MSNYVACREFELTLVLARDVENVRKLFKPKIYALVKIGDNKGTQKKTPTAKPNETNPMWNHTMQYIIAANDVHQYTGLNLVIELYTDRTLGDKRVGYMSIPICALFRHDANSIQGGITSLEFFLVTDAGYGRGWVTIAYRFGAEKYVKKLSTWKKLANVGTSIAVHGAIMSTTGLHVPIPIRVVNKPQIVCSKATAHTIFGEEFLADIILEIVQNIV
ncbi:hypothetical protein LguiA_018140 [Lonicera macranthoides]